MRVICHECKEEDELAENFAEDYSIPKDAVIYKSVGCKKCNYTGFSGRRSIGELLVMNDSVKELLKVTTDEHTIKTQLEKDGLKTISKQLLQMLLDGETTLDEAIRIGLGHA